MRPTQSLNQVICPDNFVFTPKGARKPDLSPRPWAWCFECDTNVKARQSWRDPKVKVGRYGIQYDYRCPNRRCRHAIVEPYVRPAATAIDWTNLGTRIGQRRTPLAPTTMSRIRAGLEMYPHRPSTLTITHGKDGDARAFDPNARPLPTRSTKQGEALLVPAGGSWNTDAAHTDAPLRARTTRESEALVTLPEPYIVEYRNHSTANPVSSPLAGLTAQGNHHALVVPGGQIADLHHNTLVIPYRKGASRTAGHPFHTFGTKSSAAVVRSAPDLDDCRFRMLQPREQLLGQRFPADYIVFGSSAAQTMQAGNAVSVNVARWIGTQVQAVL
ncbi:DNA cytosine methyltransferase [Kitasatospora sp. NPDC002227]|uniref:DNA cytosine methyltransferase n=1 Tax=Kitasatospora sp. NPDC002227 TaxID=3154773 RepID=UPI0033190159